MSTLLLRLAGPLQSWGDSSRFSRRETRFAPTKSGVLGLLAAAGGRRRTDAIEDLTELRFGIRVDQPGRLVRDYQTARPQGAPHSGLSNRYYLADAVFVAGVEGDQALLEGLHDAIRRPAFPLFLGRRSCPPEGAVTLGVFEAELEQALRAHRWEAAPWFRRQSERIVRLEMLLDAQGADDAEWMVESVRDVPLSFDSTHRTYGWRDVVRADDQVTDNSEGRSTDFFAAVARG